MVCKRVKIIGRVQGVWFRDTTQRKAAELGVRGCVRNEPDGSVAAEFHADDAVMAEMLDWCWIGSPNSKVERVDVNDCDDPAPEGFNIRY
mgnify:CR=1 FL=1